MASNSTKTACTFKVRLGQTVVQVAVAWQSLYPQYQALVQHAWALRKKPELHMRCQKHIRGAFIYIGCASVVNMPSD